MQKGKPAERSHSENEDEEDSDSGDMMMVQLPFTNLFSFSAVDQCVNFSL